MALIRDLDNAKMFSGRDRPTSLLGVLYISRLINALANRSGGSGPPMYIFRPLNCVGLEEVAHLII